MKNEYEIINKFDCNGIVKTIKCDDTSIYFEYC